jgi:hypothetical protein
MEATLGISLYSHLNLKLGKTLCLSHCLLCFLFNKIGEKEGCPEGAVAGVGMGVWGVGQTIYTQVIVKTIKIKK